MNRTIFSQKWLTLALLLLLSPVVSAESLSFSKAKRELVKYYKTLPDAKTFYCGCEIAWEGKKGGV